MSPSNHDKPMAGYIRVSRVMGRNGDSFISPDVQRASIERWAAAYGIKLAEVVEELDVSGGKAAADRELGRLIKLCESGELGGIIVWKLSRFGRKAADVIVNADKLTDADARLVAVEDGLDTAAKGSTLTLHVFAALAQMAREERAEGWDTAVGSAVARGIHATRTPLGYKRRDVDAETGRGSGPLVLDPETAPAVGLVFRARADGASLAECVSLFEAETGRRVSRSTLAGMLQSRTYLGEAHHGAHVKADAHPAIVDAATFERAQLGGRFGNVRPTHNGAVASQGILAGGLVRCASCGKPLSVNAAGPQGARVTSYYCRKDAAGEPCDGASGRTADVDAVVVPGILERLSHADRERKAATVALRKARAAVDEVEARREALTARLLDLSSLIDPARAKAESEKLDAEAAAAWERFSDAERRLSALGSPVDAETWDTLDVETRRRYARAFVERVEVRKSRARGRHAEPVAERVRVVWKDEAEKLAAA